MPDGVEAGPQLEPVAPAGPAPARPEPGASAPDQTDQFTLDERLRALMRGAAHDTPPANPPPVTLPPPVAFPPPAAFPPPVAPSTPADDPPTGVIPAIPAIPVVREPHSAPAGERAGEAPSGPDSGQSLRTRKIDESLVRLTAIHAGLGAEVAARVSGSAQLPSVTVDAALAHPPTPASVGLRLAKLALVGLAAVLFTTTGIGWGAKSWLDTKLRSIAALDPFSEYIVDGGAQRGDENFLLVGSDTRAGVADPDDPFPAGSARSVPGARSDTVMVAHIPASRDRVVVVSFPRDLQVDRPACERWDAGTQSYSGGSVPSDHAVKLNTAFEVGGPRCVTKVVQRLSGLSVNHFTAIDFAGFKEMVDAVRGVPICLDRPVVDSVLGKVVPTSGETVLAGDQALAFVRARHVRGDPTSDYGRIERQQRFMSALLRRGLSSQVLLSPATLRAFVTAFGSHTLSDHAGIDDLTELGASLRNLDPAQVTFVTVPTVGKPNREGNEVLRTEDTARLFAAIRADQPLTPADSGAAAAAPTDDAAPRALGAGTAPARVRLTVRNGSSQAGAAGKVADNLRSLGFTVPKVGDAAPAGHTVIRHSPDRTDQAATVASSVPGATTEEVPDQTGLLELVLGDDFDGEVKAPLDAGGDAGGAGPPRHLSTVNAGDDSCR